jgi:hypothetical protein
MILKKQMSEQNMWIPIFVFWKPRKFPLKSGPVRSVLLLCIFHKLQEVVVTSFLRSLGPGQPAQGSLRIARSTFLSGSSVCFWALRRRASIRRKYPVT